MKYAAYSEYKTSASNWLDAVPSHWNVKPLKLIVKIPITDGPHETPEFTPDGVPFASVEAVWDGKVHLSSVRGYISEEDHRRYSKKYHPKRGDIFIVKSGSTTGKIAIVDFDDDFNVWSPLAAVRCDDSQAHPEFVFYALSSSYFQRLVQVSWSFGTQPNIGMGVLGNLPAVLPPPTEQQTIARFLDAKTAQIDALVAQKRQLIAKLKEKRQALIARTVTRGLPPEAAQAAGLEPNTEMKDSQIFWIGEIPAHWICAKTAFFFSSGMGQTILKEELTDEGLPVYSATEGDHFFGRLMDPKLRLNRGDIVVPARGNSIGHVKLVNEESTTTQTTIYFKNRVPHRIDSEYAFFLMKGLRHHLFEFDQTAIPQITVDQVLGNPFLIPPIDEQLAICKFLKIKEAEASDMLQTVETAIDRLTEYRQALITSAVTGKIDVRELA